METSHFLQISKGLRQNLADIRKGEMKLLTPQLPKAVSFGSLPAGDFTWREKGYWRETDMTLLGLTIPTKFCAVFLFCF